MMNLVFEKMAQTLAAGEKWILGVAGSFVRLSECAWPVSVTLIRENRIVGTMNNMQAGDYAQGVEFDSLWVVNGATAQPVGVQISGGGAGSNRVLGEVSVINGELNRVKANQCFIALGNSPAVAGQFSQSQLWNPVGSGKNLILNAAAITSGGTGFVALKTYGVPLANVQATFSKKLDGAAPVGQVRTDANISQVGAYLGLYGFDAALKTMDFKFTEPIYIPPGFSVMAAQQVVNTQLLTTFQWIEEQIQ